MGDGRPTDHVVFHVVVDHTVFFRRQIGHQVTDIGRIKRRGLRCHPAGEIGVADDGHAILGHDFLVHLGQLAVAALFRRQIDDHRTGLHRCDHIFGPQLRRFAVGDQSGGDDDIDLGGQLAELGQLRLAEFRRGNRGIATGGRAVLLLFLEIEVDKLGPHRFNLFGHFWTHVKGQRDRAKGCGRADRGQTGNTGTDNQNLRRRHLARRRDLTGKEAAKVVACLDHRTVARDVSHGRQRVHFLRAADPGDHLHRDDSGAFLGRLFHLGLIGHRTEERDQRLVGPQHRHFFGVGDADLGHDIRRLPKLGRRVDHLYPGFDIFIVGKTSRLACASFDHTAMTKLLQLQR